MRNKRTYTPPPHKSQELFYSRKRQLGVSNILRDMRSVYGLLKRARQSNSIENETRSIKKKKITTNASYVHAVGPMQFYEFRFYRKELFFVKFVSSLPKPKRNHLVYMTPSLSPLFPITKVLSILLGYRIPGIRSEISYKNTASTETRRIVFPETFPFRFGRFAGGSRTI